MTAAQRLAQLSGLTGVSAAEHLKRIALAAGVAGALLVAYSGLPAGSAAQHLLTDRSVVQSLPTGSGGGAAAGVAQDDDKTWRIERKQRIDKEQAMARAALVSKQDAEVIEIVAVLISTGILDNLSTQGITLTWQI